MAITGILNGDISWVAQPAPQNWAAEFANPSNGANTYIGIETLRLRCDNKFSVFISFKLQNILAAGNNFCLLYRGDDVGVFTSDAAGASASGFSKTEVAIACQTISSSGLGIEARFIVVLPGRDRGTGRMAYVARSSKAVDIQANQWCTFGATYNGARKRNGINLYFNGDKVSVNTGVDYSSKLLITSSAPLATNELRAFYHPGPNIPPKLGFAGGVVKRIAFWDVLLTAEAMLTLHNG